MAIELIKISEFPQVSEPGDWIVVSDAAGTGYKISKEDFKEWLGTVTVISDKPIALSDPAPELDGVYLPTESGTYTNAGGLVYDPEGVDAGKYVQFIKNDTVWTKLAVDLPQQDLSGLATKSEMESRVPFSSVTGEPSGNQLFNKTDIRRSFLINSTGGLIISSSNSIVTQPIELKSGQTSITISGLATGENHRAMFTNALGDLVGTVSTFSSAAITLTIPTGATHIIVWFQNAADPIDASLNTFMLNYGTTALPYEPFTGQLKSVAGFDVPAPDLQDYYTKSQVDSMIPNTDDLVSRSDIDVSVISNQKFDKTKYRTGFLLSVSGRPSTSSSQGSLITYPIPLNGATHVAASGMTEGLNHRIAFWIDDIGGSESVVGTVSSFTDSSNIVEVPAGALYVVVWFRNGAEPEENLQAVLNNFTVNFSDVILPTDDYKEAVTAIDGKPIAGTGATPEPEPLELPEYIDNRFEQLSNLYSEDSIVSRNTAFVNSLRRLSDSPAVLKTINIPNALGTVQKDVIVPIHLYNHAGSDVANGFNHVFLDGLVNNDFSDIRAFANGVMLDMSIESSGNYSAFPIPFANPRTVDIIFEDGLYFITGSDGVQSSPDLVNWTNILPDVTLAFVDADGNVYGKKAGQLPLFKFYKSTGYTTEKQVISVPGAASSVWRYKNFIVDIFGHIYVGSYQEEFLTYIYKSTDMGETFTAVFTPSLSDSQHCHNLVIDKTVTPNIIYASFDGNGSEPGKRSQWVSKDYGVTWTRSDLDNKLGGIPVDSGIAHADGSLLIGVSEGAIKGTPSIYTSLNQGKSFDIHLWGQNTHTVYQLDNLYLIAGTANKANKDSILWGTYDLVNIFPINQTTYLENATSTGWGYRYGSYHPIPDPEGGDCIILTATSSGVPPALKLKVGEDYYSALVYVKVPELPAGGINIEIRNGFLIGEPYHDFFNDDVTGAAYRFPLNERVSKLPYAELTDNPRWIVTNGLGRVRPSTSSRNMRELQGMLKLTDFSINENLDLVINSTNGISVSFWFGRELTGGSLPTQAILQIGDILIEASTKVRMTVFGEVFTISGAMIPNTVKKPNLFTATVSKSQLSVYVNNRLMEQFPIVANADRIINSLKVGNAKALTPKQDVYISDLRIYDRVLQYSDVNIVYNRANLYNR